MTEAQERFLRAIADRVPPATIAELHLFPAIRQGGYETGIAVVAAQPAAEPPHRLIVLSARYRLTLKGADRGKWDVEVVAQADAPLVTVDAVVRGVQRRAGDTGDPERLSGDALRALLDEWTCTTTTR